MCPAYRQRSYVVDLGRNLVDLRSDPVDTILNRVDEGKDVRRFVGIVCAGGGNTVGLIQAECPPSGSADFISHVNYPVEMRSGYGQSETVDDWRE